VTVAPWHTKSRLRRLGGKRGAGLPGYRVQGPRIQEPRVREMQGVENTGSDGKCRDWWKTCGLSGKHGETFFCFLFVKI